MRKWIVFAVLVPFAAMAGGSSLVGTWKLESYMREVIATGERYQMFGEHPSGYLSYAPDGRMFAILTMDKRSTPRDAVPSDEEKAKLFGSMISCTGTYTLEPDKVVHHVDVSWNQAWNGTDQVRFYKLDGETLTITSASAKSAIDGKEGRSVLVWKRVNANKTATTRK